jgi:hypothetical protein
MTTYKIASAIASAALIASVFAPSAFADNTVDVVGNGTGSDNVVTISDNNGGNTSVNQSNTSTVVTGVDASSNTGGNNANNNTGGNTGIQTGAATTSVVVSVAGGTNTATNVNPCGCEGGDNTVTIAGNGSNSNNTVVIGNGGNSAPVNNLCILWWCNGNSQSGNKVKQKNNATVVTSVKAKSKTGKNTANANTGGSTGIVTNNASTGVNVTVSGSSNTVHGTGGSL